MEDKYSEIKNKMIVVMIILYIAMTIGINIYYYKVCRNNFQISICALDGIVSFMIENRNVIGTETMLLSFFVFYVINPNLNNEYLCQYRSRREIYIKQVKQTFQFNCMFTLGNAVISFLAAWILSGRILNWDSPASLYYRNFNVGFHKNFIMFELYLLLSILSCICIVQCYLMFYLLLYWLIASRNVTFFIGIVLSWALGRPVIPAEYKLTSNTIMTVHSMIQDRSIIAMGALKYAVAMAVIMIITNVVLKRRDLL